MTKHLLSVGLSQKYNFGDSSRRPLELSPPTPITELDNDTVTDVYQVYAVLLG